MDFMIAIIALLLLIYLTKVLLKLRRKNLIKTYFYQRQVGSIADIKSYTKLDEKKIAENIQLFILEDKIELLLPSPAVYKWTENRNYPEGMISKEIKI
ncbi:MAG: hypothetical protein ACH34X_14820 [Thiolinea sp.]